VSHGRLGRVPVGSKDVLAKSEKRQDRENNNDQADDIDNAVHDLPFISATKNLKKNRNDRNKSDRELEAI